MDTDADMDVDMDIDIDMDIGMSMNICKSMNAQRNEHVMFIYVLMYLLYTNIIHDHYTNVYIKETVAQDFLPQVFLVDLLYMGPRF